MLSVASPGTVGMNAGGDPAVWFPTVRTGTGTDVFTERLADGLTERGIRTEITWLPLRAEYAPWTVPVPGAPEWANVAHVNTWLHPRFLPKRMPIVATIHHSAHHPDARAYKGAVRAAYHRFWIAPNERRVLCSANQVVAVSRFVAEIARTTLVDVPMQVIYNGVDTEKFRLGHSQRTQGEPFRLLYVGSWKRLKGVDLLAPIMRELGSGFELHYTRGAVAERDEQGTPPNMHDIGRLVGDGAVAAAMNDADALLFASRSEGLPLVVIEAMACGLPVITTRGSSLIEVVDDGITGILCPQDDIDAFVGAARKLAANGTLASNMSKAARQRVLQHFSARYMIDKCLEVYRVGIRQEVTESTGCS